MCMACQMEDELWAAYFEHVARQQAAQPEKAAAAPADAAPASKAAPAAPFACEELPPE